MSTNTTTAAKPAAPKATEQAEAAKTEATAEAPRAYDPATDSTPTYVAEAKKTGRLVIDITDGACPCGCGGQAKARFLPGHDAKLKGKLARAAVAEVTILLVQGKEKQEASPRQFAKVLSNAKHDWVAALDEAVKRAKEQAEEAKARKEAAAKKRAERAAVSGRSAPKLSLGDFALATSE